MRDELFYLNDEHLADELSKLERDQLIEKVTSLVKDKRELIKKYEWIESRYFDFAASVDYDLNIGLKMQKGRKIDRADNLSKALTITIHRWYDQYDKFPTWKQALYGLAIDGHSNIQEIDWETEETGTVYWLRPGKIEVATDFSLIPDRLTTIKKKMYKK